MKKLHRLLYILPLVLSLHSCVFDDLSDCPTDESGLILSLSYNLAGEGAAGVLPLERADFYIFDARKRFVCSVTDQDGPFTAVREYRVALPEGDYTVVSWANLHGKLAVSPEPLTAGQTTLDEARVHLAGLPLPAAADTKTTLGDVKANGAGPVYGATAAHLQTTAAHPDELAKIGGVDKNLYYGTVQSVRVHTGQSTPAVVGLKRTTKIIRLSVRYKYSDGTPCNDPLHYPDAFIRTADGIFKFDNTLSPCRAFLLESTQRDDDITGGFDATFHKMTLRLDEPVESEIILTDPGNPSEVIYKENLMKWLRGTGYDSQEKLDATHEYLVELRFGCSQGGGGTHTTLRIFVNGWEYVPMYDNL